MNKRVIEELKKKLEETESTELSDFIHNLDPENAPPERSKKFKYLKVVDSDQDIWAYKGPSITVGTTPTTKDDLSIIENETKTEEVEDKTKEA
jgi:hypothetical protein